MHEQAQLRRQKDEIEKLGAAAYVILSQDVYRTSMFKEQNLVLSTFNGPFAKEKSLVFGTALSDPAGRAAALYGVSRRYLRGDFWFDNQPHWFVIDRKGTLTYSAEPNFTGANF